MTILIFVKSFFKKNCKFAFWHYFVLQLENHTRTQQMRKIYLLLSLMIITTLAYSQSSNLIVFSENGERFQVVLNGILQNAQAETNVLITDLIAPSYKLKLLFENPNIPDLDKTVYFNDPGVQMTMKLKLNKKGKYVLRLFNAVPIAQAPPRPPSQHIIMYSTTPAVVTQTTTTTTSGNGYPNGNDNVNVNMNVNGINMNMNVNAGANIQTSTTTTTTTTTSGGINNIGSTTTYVLPGYNGDYGCPYPMSRADFESAKRSIAGKSFSDSKLKLAKQIINTNCLLSTQVMQLMELFDFENDKLDLAKYAYGYTLDIGNYYRVNDAFEFESSIDELDHYINSFRR